MQYDKNNIFAKIIRGEIPCNKVYEDDICIAFHDISPAAPTHILVLPKGDYISFDDFTENADPKFIAAFFQRIRKVAHIAGVEKNGYRLLCNHGKEASQTVFHFHVHILGGRPLGGLVANDPLNR